ncbi:hemolysin family protein [Candidatus Phycosocius spiralis]|uniref:Ion transporter n=1 Tax=Candidatus Phycosocius spiralis TaxID=2815099 RepID=A0ABQ4PXC8_9PROT|nr:hemolysin family protein [Candidatus Phycosocius spiralis]GIU67721.1 ion transporter [Candidatus Phycosocius spiralis]
MTMTDDPSSSQSRPKSSLWKRWVQKLRRQEAAAGLDPAQLLRERAQSGETIERTQKDMIVKAASFDRLSVRDVMVPRADITAVDLEMTLGQVARMFEEHQHSRMPVYAENLDTPVGFIHVKDILSLLIPDADGIAKAKLDELVLSRLKRDLLYVPISMKLPNLLLQMRAKRCHMALVIDEYGGTDGLVTIEDLVEEIIGDIDDEHDDLNQDLIVETGNGVWEADARVELDDFSARAGVDFALEDMEDDIDTLGGLVFALAGRVPPRGEILHHPTGYDFEVIDADPRRIKRVRVRSAKAVAHGGIDPIQAGSL